MCEMGRNRFDFANLFASFLHLSWGIIFSCLWAFKKKSDGGHRDLFYPLYSSYSSWNATEIELVTSDALTSCAAPRSLHFGDMTVSPAWNDAEISLSLHWLVTSFFFLSAFFQFLAVMIPRSLVPNAVIRFVEYSISASVMIVAIGLQLGIFHAQIAQDARRRVVRTRGRRDRSDSPEEDASPAQDRAQRVRRSAN